MKKIIISLVALFIFGNVFSQGIQFEPSIFKQALEKAKKENKMLFVDCYTVWCGPCKFLSKQIFVQKEVGDFFNENFVSVKIDMETPEGRPLTEKYEIGSYPTLLWLDGDGILQHKFVGSCDANRLIDVAKKAADVNNNLAGLSKQYNEGNREAELVRKYIWAMLESKAEVDDIVNNYFASRKLEDLINVGDAELIASSIKNPSNPIFEFALENREKFYAVADKKQFALYLEHTLGGELMQFAVNKDMDGFENRKKELVDLYDELGTKVCEFVEMQILSTEYDKVKFFHALANFVLKYDSDDAEKLNKYAWMIVGSEEVLDDELLGLTVKMAKSAVELDANFANIDTYAFALYQSGNKEEAMTQAKKAVEIAPEEYKQDMWTVKYINGDVE